jgi:hypothetical protein
LKKDLVHIDQFFKDKVETQAPENAIPSFEAFSSAANLSQLAVSSAAKTGIAKIIGSKIVLSVVAGTSIVAVTTFISLTNQEDGNAIPANQPATLENPALQPSDSAKHLNDNSIKYTPTPKVSSKPNVNGVTIESSSNASPTESASELPEVQTKSIDLPKVEETLTNELAKEQPKVETKKEEPKVEKKPKGLDAFIEKHKTPNEKGVDLYKK